MKSNNNSLILFNNFIFDILEDLKGDSKRFTDLYNSCHNEATRSKKLKELEKCGIIERQFIKKHFKKQKVIAYSLTEKGKKILKHLESIKCMHDSN